MNILKLYEYIEINNSVTRKQSTLEMSGKDMIPIATVSKMLYKIFYNVIITNTVTYENL